MNITRKSAISGKVRTRDIPVNPEDMLAWESGSDIETAMPYLTSDDREFILSGITAQEWARAFEES